MNPIRSVSMLLLFSATFCALTAAPQDDTGTASRRIATPPSNGGSAVIREMASIRPHPGTAQTAARSACFHRAVVTTSVRSHQGPTDLTVFDLAGSVVYSKGARSATRTGTGAFVSRQR